METYIPSHTSDETEVPFWPDTKDNKKEKINLEYSEEKKTSKTPEIMYFLSRDDYDNLDF